MSQPLQAASLIWDTASGDGATTTDGAGTWSNGGANWNTGTTDTTWSNATPDSATFGSGNGAAGTVTLGSNITVGNIVFNAPGSGTYSIVPNGFSLTLSNSTVTVNASSATITAPLVGSSGLTKDGSGTLVLNNDSFSSTYTGTTTINAGTLQITGGGFQLPTSTAVVLANTAGATLDLGGTFTIIGSLAGGGAAGGNVITTLQLLVDSNTSTTYAGSITGSGSIVKGGSGTLTLTGNNTYTSFTDIQVGVVKLDTGGSLSSTSRVTLQGGSTLLIAGAVNNQINTAANVVFNNGTLKIDGSVSLSQTLGSVSLSNSSTIDFGTTVGGNTLSFANSSGNTWSGTALNIYNWTAGSDHLFFGTNSSGLTSAQLAKLNFYSDAGTTLISSGGAISASGEVSAVPEPSSVLGALSLLGLAGFRERRWFLRCKDARRR